MTIYINKYIYIDYTFFAKCFVSTLCIHDIVYPNTFNETEFPYTSIRLLHTVMALHNHKWIDNTYK